MMSGNRLTNELAPSTIAEVQPITSAGLTTKVVRGSLWTLGGQAITMLVMLITTPYIIRRLGAEAYGVLTLINVLIGYLAFADMGMGKAATRFAADAHTRQDNDGEAAVVWTSLLIAFIPAGLSAALLATFAGPLVEHVLRLPEHLHYAATWALRLAALGFIARTLAGVMMSPQLVRLRMDLIALVVAGTGVAQNCLVALALWLRGGLIIAVAVVTGMAVLMLAAHVTFSSRLLPQVSQPRVRRALLKPLLAFGGGLVLSTLAAMVLVNIEKLLLPRLASVTALAHYGVAYSIAGVLAMAPAAMQQALLPAFSRLYAAREPGSLKHLYTRALRGNLLWIGPAALLLCAGAKPFFTLWAGPEYGVESTLPFYILIVGLMFNVMASVPYTLVMAYGRSDLIARFHVGELIPYVLCTGALTYRLGATGAALAWTLRVAVDAVLFAVAAHRISGFSFSPLPVKRGSYAMAVALLLLPLAFIGKATIPSATLVIAVLVAILAYAHIIWLRVLSLEERAWLYSLNMWRRPVGNT
jgi:O-antigen/teichoic acid export membrane protein